VPAPARLTPAPGDPPVVLLHGSGSNANTWERVAARLTAAGHRVHSLAPERFCAELVACLTRPVHRLHEPGPAEPKAAVQDTSVMRGGSRQTVKSTPCASGSSPEKLIVLVARRM
jgi:hypothetical protein